MAFTRAQGNSSGRSCVHLYFPWNLNVKPPTAVSGYPGVPWILATMGAVGATRESMYHSRSSLATVD
jgi:hypothetical protein